MKVIKLAQPYCKQNKAVAGYLLRTKTECETSFSPLYDNNKQEELNKTFGWRRNDIRAVIGVNRKHK